MAKLWISPGSCSLVPHVLLLESGLEFDLVVINVMSGFPKEHLKVNPKGRVPILELGDGSILTEVPAIVTYISQLVPDKQLLGRTGMEVVRAYEWFNWLSGTVHGHGFSASFRPGRYLEDEATHDAIRRRGHDFVKSYFEMIEEKLAGVHAVGDSFTAVDVYLWVLYRWGYIIKLDMTTLFPKYTKLVEELIERETVKAVVQKEGIPAITRNWPGSSKIKSNV